MSFAWTHGLAAVGIEFFFPDEQPFFDLFNDVAAAFKSFIPVSGPDADPNGGLGGFQLADPLDAYGLGDGKFGKGFLDYFFTFRDDRAEYQRYTKAR